MGNEANLSRIWVQIRSTDIVDMQIIQFIQRVQQGETRTVPLSNCNGNEEWMKRMKQRYLACATIRWTTRALHWSFELKGSTVYTEETRKGSMFFDRRRRRRRQNPRPESLFSWRGSDGLDLQPQRYLNIVHKLRFLVLT